MKKAMQSPFLSALLGVPFAYIGYLVCINLVFTVNLWRPAYAFAGTSKAIVICHKTGCSCSNETRALVDQSLKLSLPVVVVYQTRDEQIQLIEQAYDSKKVRVVLNDKPYVTSQFSPTGKVTASFVHYGKILRQVPGDVVINAAFIDESQGAK